MFTPALNVARRRKGGDGHVLIPAQYLPDGYSFSQLYDELASNKSLSKQASLENILVLSICLGNQDRITREAGDEDAVKNIATWVSETILPDDTTVPRDDIPSDSETARRHEAVVVSQQLGLDGLRCLQTLLEFLSPLSRASCHNVFLSAVSFTSSRDPWTTTSSPSIATDILRENAHEVEGPDFIIDFLLQSIIRPLFSKSKPAAITAAGRKAMPSSAPPRNYNISESLDPARKPWKYTSPFSIAVLEWAVTNSSENIMERSWNLFIPPLVTLLDDPSTHIRSRALSILSSFLPKIGGKRLKQTGLAEVFEEAVMPTLMFLPSITPVDESMQLLPPAYNALFVLADVRWGKAINAQIEPESKVSAEKLKFYDHIMRKGILTGYGHAHEHVKIVALLTEQIGIIVEKMGLAAVKHLKDILPILSYGLTDPFSSSIQLLLTAITTLQTVILACWPRISQPEHRRNILKSIVLCWKNLEDGKIEEKKTKDELKSVTRLFISAVEAPQHDGANSDINDEISALVDADPRLKELFNR